MEVIRRHPVEYVKYHSGLGKLCAFYARPRAFKTRVSWYYGASGTGKTRAAYAEATELLRGGVPVPEPGLPLCVPSGESPYFKPGGDWWWDGYFGQKAVVIDDYRAGGVSTERMLTLLDRYPLLVPRKGDYVQFVSTHVFITSPLSPQATWMQESDEAVLQLLRRIEVIKRFTGDGVDPVVEKFIE